MKQDKKHNNMDKTDRHLLNLLQANFPLKREPFVEIGTGLGLDESDVISRIKRLKDEGIIRGIEPLLNARSLGYQSTLVAMRLPEEKVDTAARIISDHPGISHAHIRDSGFNLWFTISLPGDSDIEGELRTLAGQVGSDEMINLPRLRTFKIAVYFDMVGTQPTPIAPLLGPQYAVPLEPVERRIINELQQDLPLDHRPFDNMAERAGLHVEDFLTRCRALEERGIMRRFGASIRHRKAGFVANVMVCWNVPSPMVEQAAEKMSSFKEVSHCYERRKDEKWPYNLFTMIHGKTKEDCTNSIRRISEESGIEEYRALFTVREIKKERIKYLI